MTKRLPRRPTAIIPGLLAAALLAACTNKTPSEAPPIPNADAAGATTQGNSIGVNTFLWRASLDTVHFMPVASADPFGGVIITDWYAPPDTPNERFKLNIFILDRQLRSDAIRATVFRQTQTADAHWVDAPVDPKTAGGVETAILTRARQLRIASVAAP